MLCACVPAHVSVCAGGRVCIHAAGVPLAQCGASRAATSHVIDALQPHRLATRSVEHSMEHSTDILWDIR